MFRRLSPSLSFRSYDQVHQQQTGGPAPLELLHPDRDTKIPRGRGEQRWRFSLLSVLAAFLLYAGLASNAQVTPGTPSFVPQDCHEFDCIDLLNNNVMLNVPIRNKSGLFPMNAGLTMNSYMEFTGLSPFAWWPGTTGPLGYRINGVIAGAYTVSGDQTGYLNSAPATCPTGGASTTKFWNFYFLTADGTSHILPSTDVTYESPCNNNSPLTDSVIDGTGYVLTVNNGAVSTV